MWSAQRNDIAKWFCPCSPFELEGKANFLRKYFRTIIELLRLEKISKITKSNRHPITTMSDKSCPEVLYLHVFWKPPEMVTPLLPWAAYFSAWPLIQWINFSIIQSEPPLTQLETISSCPNSSCLGDQHPPHYNLLSGSCRERQGFHSAFYSPD